MSKDVAVQQPTIFAEGGVGHAAAAWGTRLRKLGTLARQNPLGTLGLVIIVVFVLAALLAPLDRAVRTERPGRPAGRADVARAPLWDRTRRS